MIAEWTMAVWIAVNGAWGSPTTKIQSSESACLQSARTEWKNYWATGKEDDSSLRVRCYSQDERKQYWVRCTKYDSCTVKG